MIFRIALSGALLWGGAAVAQRPASGAQARWVDSVYNRLTPRERLGQLFMVAAYSGGKNANEAAVTRLVEAHQVGGLIFMQGGPVRQAVLTNKYQRLAQVPLLLAMDAEWGLGMRLDSVQNFPRQMMIGATRDTALMYRIGSAIAGQCRRMGVHVDFAPDVDVNNNPDNPVINSRSFGENKAWVAKLGIAYMKGLQDGGVMACAKHFPGHGNTAVDSHKDLPTVSASRAQLDSLELYPFRELIRAGVQSAMVAHLEVPALEPQPKLPTTLSKATITGVLKGELGFKGLVFTDALNMEGVAKYYAPGEVDLRAFLAGNDVLLFSQDVPTALTKMEEALKDGRIRAADLEVRVKKILETKWRAGLASFRPVATENLTADLNRLTAALRQATAEAAITQVGASNNALNFLRQRGARVGYIGVNAGAATPLSEALEQNLGNGFETRWLPKGSTLNTASSLVKSLDRYDAVVVGVHGIGMYPSGNYGLDAAALAFLKQAAEAPNAVLVFLGNAYAMKGFCGLRSALVAYEGDSLTQLAAAQVLLGKQPARGVLPVTPCPGLKTTAVLPAATDVPLYPPVAVPADLTPAAYGEAGVTRPGPLSELNAQLGSAIARNAFPGCRVLAARNGKVFYDAAFGRLTYSPTSPAVTKSTVYDVASLTKVLATTLAVMKLWEDGKISLDATLGTYLPQARGTNKEGIRLRDLLLHRAGLEPYIPFWKETLDSTGNLDATLYRKAKERGFETPVADSLWVRNDYRDTVWARILASPLKTPGRYVYSDNDFYFLAAVVEKVSGKTLPAYAAEKFYGPLGLQRTGFNPLNRFFHMDIAPTELDFAWRQRQVWGTVHDQGAALIGGVAGHAGLFATANDVAVIFQMLLNGGTYGGKRLLKRETVAKFTAYGNAGSRRGLGFDKPEPGTDASVTSDRCSGRTFGHTGFTGTCAWADPATGIVFVFLSNRVYPSADNSAITKLGVRTEAQDRIYESFGLPVVRDRAATRSLDLKESGR